MTKKATTKQCTCKPKPIKVYRLDREVKTIKEANLPWFLLPQAM